MIDFLIHNTYTWTGNHTLAEFAAGYVFGGALIIGAPGVFFFIVFNPALQRTKGAQIGYKDQRLTETSHSMRTLRLQNKNPLHITSLLTTNGCFNTYTKCK